MTEERSRLAVTVRGFAWAAVVIDVLFVVWAVTEYFWDWPVRL